MAASEDWDLSVALGSSTSPGSEDLDPSAAPISSVGPGSWEPDPSVEDLPSSCRSCGSGRSATMLTVSEVAAM
jgi:hypothetical protein